MRIHLDKVHVRHARAVTGFTLVELMVTVAVLAILAAIAYPSFTSIINSNRLTSSANELVAAIQIARSESVRLNQRVAVCASNVAGTACQNGGSWNNWLVVRLDTNEVLRTAGTKAPVEVRGSNNVTGNTGRIVFTPDGFARDVAGLLLVATVSVCIPTASPPQNVRHVRISGGSRVNVEAAVGAGACAAPGNAP